MYTVFSQSARRSGPALQFLFFTYKRASTILVVLAVMTGLATAWAASSPHG